MDKPDYGSYVPRGMVAAPLVAALLCFALSRKVKGRRAKVLLFLLALASMFSVAFMAVTVFLYRDSRKIAMRDAVLALLPWDGKGKALDIGTGSGLLAIGLAGRLPRARVVGTDIWRWSRGAGVGSTRERAEANATAEGVGDRVTFEVGDARDLPFGDGSFDAVVTSIAWHNIMTRDRYSLIGEALRVLKPGGAFMFFDLFKRKTTYGDFEALIDRLRGDSSSVTVTELEDIQGAGFSPLEDRWMCAISGKK